MNPIDVMRGNGNGQVRITGNVGKSKVDLVVEGAELRDLFGAAALLGWLSESVIVTSPAARASLARQSYEIADAMVAARKGRKASNRA